MTAITIALIIFMVIREIIHYVQVTKLQELLKSSDITEYYRAKQGSTVPSPSTNKVMETPNKILEAEDFDIRKVSEVIIDGQPRPINII